MQPGMQAWRKGRSTNDFQPKKDSPASITSIVMYDSMEWVSMAKLSSQVRYKVQRGQAPWLLHGDPKGPGHCSPQSSPRKEMLHVQFPEPEEGYWRAAGEVGGGEGEALESVCLGEGKGSCWGDIKGSPSTPRRTLEVATPLHQCPGVS